MSSVESAILARVFGETDKMGKIIISPLSSNHPDSICRGCGLTCNMEISTEKEIRYEGCMTKIKMPCHDKPECIALTMFQFNDIYQHIASKA
jgi:uncharacterized cysteine cluster protein YcgN (CxxCxxCC family)